MQACGDSVDVLPVLLVPVELLDSVGGATVALYVEVSSYSIGEGGGGVLP